MLESTVGQILINEGVPKPLRDYNRVFDQNGMNSFLRALAKDFPDEYKKTVKHLADVGGEVAFRQGGLTFGLHHLQQSGEVRDMVRDLKGQIQSIHQDDKLTPEQKHDRTVKLLGDSKSKMQELSYGTALKAKNPLALQASLGFRGDPGSINSMIGADMMYSDAAGKPIPLPILRSYSQGLTPFGFLASSFGTRQGVAATKLATAESGALNKQLTQAAHRVIVGHDDDENDWYKPEQIRGLPVKTNDIGNVGAVLAHDAGGLSRNTILTPRMLAKLKEDGVEDLLVRSPMVGGAADGSIHSRDAGLRTKSTLPSRGFVLGVQGGQGVGEPLTQMQLCLAGGTLVRMADWSVKPIEDIQIGDWVMGSNRHGDLAPTRVVNTYRNGEKECVSTSFGVGGTKERIELISTPDHKVAGIARYWGPKVTKAVHGILPVGQKCLTFSGIMANSVLNTSGVSEPYALLIGVLLGDGCYTTSVKGIHLSCHDPLLIKDTKKNLQSLGLKATKLKGHKGYYHISQLQDIRRPQKPTGGYEALGGAVNPIKKELIRRGMYGKYAHEKTIPADVWQWDQSSVSELIAGYFATDGSVYQIKSKAEGSSIHVTFGSVSLPILLELKQLLAVRFGIYASLSEGYLPELGKRLAYQLKITRHKEVVRFYTSIPLYGVKKRTFNQLMRKWKQIQPKDWSLFFRKSQTPVGVRETFDIEVDNHDHLFQLANGLIVSNSKKHGGAAASNKVSGFKFIEMMANPPKNMPYGATHAQLDGTIDKVIENPAGGFDLLIGGKKHYVSSDNPLKVKEGDTVEAGDVLSEGTPNPREIVQHKGVGEGKRYLLNSLYGAYRENKIGAKMLRRNLEPVVRGIVNHVKLDDFWEGHAPDDVINYSHLESKWQPRSGFEVKSPHSSVGKYLEAPILHHTVGTKIRPSMLEEFKRFGIDSLVVHPEPPPFTPHMVRATDNLQHDPDWQVRLGGQYLERGLLDAAHRGLSSNTQSTSFIPALMQGKDLDAALAPPLPKPAAPPALPAAPKPKSLLPL